MLSLRRLFLMLCLAWAVVLPAVAAQPLLLASSVWVDGSGQATLAQAQRATFRPYRGVLSKGYIAGAVWLKLRIAAAAGQQPWVLLVKPAYLRKVDLYDPAQTVNGIFQPQHSGRATALASARYQTIDLGFELPARPWPRDIYLRIATPTSLIADCQLLTFAQAQAQSRVRLVVLTLYVGFLLVSVVWGLIYWALYRDGLYGWFALRQIYSVVYAMLLVGLYRYVLADSLGVQFGDQLYNLVLVSVLVPVVGFDTLLLSEFGASRLAIRLTYGMLSLSLISLLLLLVDQPRLALSATSLLGIVVTVLLLWQAFSVPRQAGQPLDRLLVWVLRGGFSLMVCMVFFPLLALRGLLHLGGGGVDLLIAQAGVSTVQMMVLQLIHTRQKEHALQQSQLEHSVTASLLEKESQRRAEKESFIAMIGHELRNPLSVIRLLSGSDATSRAVQSAADDMARVIDRVLQSEKYDSGSVVVHKSPVSLEALVTEALERQMQRQRIRLVVDKALMLQTDRDLLVAVLSNVVDNAIKYSPDASVVDLHVAPQAHEGQAGVVFSVSNAVGKAGPPDAAQLFTKYYRSPGAHSQVGSGLGLYLVAQWVSALGGTVVYRALADSDGGTQVNFTVWMPQ